MAIGKGSTRWDQVVQTIRDVDRARDPRAGAQISMFRFGSGLAAVNGDFWRPDGARPAAHSTPGAVLAAEPARPAEPPLPRPIPTRSSVPHSKGSPNGSARPPRRPWSFFPTAVPATTIGPI